MDLKKRVMAALTEAMKARATQRVGALRLITAAMKQIEVDERIELDDERVLKLLTQLRKQRQESEQQYRQAQRADLAEKEAFEVALIEEFLPPPVSESEIRQHIQAAITSVQASTIKDMAKVMALLRPQLQGRADLSLVGQWVKDALSSS